MNRIPAWLWAALAFIILAMLGFYLFQRTLIYAPSKTVPTREAYQAKDMQNIELTTEDELVLNAWYKPAPEGKPTIILFHGNAGHIGTRMPLARQLIQQGFGILIFDYRGYGGNSGRPSEQGLYDDARAGMQFLTQQGIPSQEIVLYGESLGTGVATKMAIEHPKSCALILQSPYTKLADLGRYHYPFIPIEPWDKFDSIGRIQNIHIPLLALHGTRDKVVPYRQGKALYKKANAPKQWAKLNQQGHGGLWSPAFIQTVHQFINEHCQEGA